MNKTSILALVLNFGIPVLAGKVRAHKADTEIAESSHNPAYMTGMTYEEALEEGDAYDPFNNANKGTMPPVPQTIPQNCPTHHHDPDGKHWPKPTPGPPVPPSTVPAVPQAPSEPPPPPVDMSKYVLKSSLKPEKQCPDMSNYVLKTNILIISIQILPPAVPVYSYHCIQAI